MSKGNTAVDANSFRKFGMRDKVAYGVGDFGCNMSFALKSFLALFWTQYMGIDSVVMATLLIIVQVWDAINDPLIGAMIDADRRTYKLGKFRTYILIGSIGLTFAGALCYIPWTGAPAMAKNLLFIAGYVIWDAFYTVANVPYGSMLPLISADPAERAQLSTWRSIGSMSGNILTMILLPFLVYDSNDNLVGSRIFLIALVMGVLGFLSFQFMIRNTIERVAVKVTCKEDTPKFNVFKAMGNFLRNRAAVGATLAPVAMFIGMYGANISSQIMFQSYFKNAQISGLVSMSSMLGMFLFMPFIGRIVKRFGKKEAISVGSFVCVLAYVLMLLLPITPDGKGLALFIGCQLLNAAGSGIGTCVSWALMADAMDYAEWKFGVREEGTTYALHSFFRKLAQGVGPSLGLVLAAAFGYNESLGSNQTPETAANMLTLTAALYLASAIFQFISYAVIYNLDKKTLAQMEDALGHNTGNS